jgi:acetyltransferase-like isoleucine patch superfamily enzyme
MRNLFQASVIILSSLLLSGAQREKLLRRLFGHEVHPTARLGLCFIAVDHLVLERETTIGHLTFIRGLKDVIMREHALIGRLNWITALPLNNPEFFKTVEDRDPSLEIGRGSVIMNRMIVDCNNRITIGEYGGFAGFRTVLMTHGVDIRENRQTAGTIDVGDRTMIATNCVLLGGTSIPERSVVGAGSVVRGRFEEPGLYSGVPAKRVGDLPQDAKFFERDTMMIY